VALEQARFEAAHARRQYDAVDPDNWLVVGEHKRRWNERLREERWLHDELHALSAAPSHGLTPGEREALLRLGANVERAWHAEGATIATRKRIVRMLIEEIVVRMEDDGLDLVIPGQARIIPLYGCARTARERTVGVLTPTSSIWCGRWPGKMPDMGIAAAANRTGKTTAKGHSWTRTRVATLRNIYGIAVYREGERAERGEATLDETTERVAVSPATVRRLIVEGVLPASQICNGAPWVICIADIQLAEVVSASERRRKRTPEPPPSGDQPALPLNFQ
jgi:hypothetical protein